MLDSKSETHWFNFGSFTSLFITFHLAAAVLGVEMPHHQKDSQYWKAQCSEWFRRSDKQPNTPKQNNGAQQTTKWCANNNHYSNNANKHHQTNRFKQRKSNEESRTPINYWQTKTETLATGKVHARQQKWNTLV